MYTSIAEGFAGKYNLKYLTLFFRFVLVLGIVLHTILAVIYTGMHHIFGFFSLMFPCYAISGIVGTSFNKWKVMVRHSRLVWLITALGFVFLVISFLSLFWSGSGVDILTYLPRAEWAGIFVVFCFFGGTMFLTSGICGIGGLYFKNEKREFTALAVILVPSFIFILFILKMSSLTVGIGI